MAPAPWLTAQPVAHRGLHDGVGVIENTIEAAEAAIQHGFAIECDVQRAACGTAMVYHDFSLERLTDAQGALAARGCEELSLLRLRGTTTKIPTLRQFLAVIAGRVPLFIEVKSRFDGSAPLVAAVAAELAGYRGHAALMSFDPLALHQARAHRLKRPLGIVSEIYGDHAEWSSLSKVQKYRLSHIYDAYALAPDFIAYNVKHLPSIACNTLREQLSIPLLTWTVRTVDQRQAAKDHADQMIFEGFVP